jgi:type II secretory pathway pseudopilin PulG
MNSNHRRRRGGFTLIELLVVIILMIMIVAVVANVFASAQEIVSRNEARGSVYTNAGFAMDRIMLDLYGCLPFDGSNRFVMLNFKAYPVPGNAEKSFYLRATGTEDTGGHYLKGTVAGANYEAPADLISFRSATTVADQPGIYQITYYLKGDPQGNERQKGLRSNRPIYTLMRRATVQGTKTLPEDWTDLPKADYDLDGVMEATIPEEEVCHYVIGFNVEYFSNTMNFSQLAGGAAPNRNPTAWKDPPIAVTDVDPLGNGLGDNDTTGDAWATPLRIPMIRITLIVIDNNGERSERVISHAFQVPMG